MPANPRKANPDTPEYQQVKQQIILTAAKLIEKNGHSKLKFDDLAVAVDLNRATLYRYFDSKQELLEAVMVLLMDELTQSVLQAVAGTRKVTNKSFADALYDVIETMRNNSRYALVVDATQVELCSELMRTRYVAITTEMLEKFMLNETVGRSLREGVSITHAVNWVLHQIVSYGFLGVPGDSEKSKKDYLMKMVVPVIV